MDPRCGNSLQYRKGEKKSFFPPFFAPSDRNVIQQVFLSADCSVCGMARRQLEDRALRDFVSINANESLNSPLLNPQT